MENLALLQTSRNLEIVHKLSYSIRWNVEMKEVDELHP